MSSSLSDPNNHVPELLPDDGWGDAEAPAAATTILPPRRSAADRMGQVNEVPPGLRIEANVARTESPLRLEVQRFGADVVRLADAAPAPPRVERLVTFHESPVREKIDAELSQTREWGNSSRHPARWMLGAGVVITAVIVGAMMMLPAINAPNNARPLPTAAEVVIEEKIEGMEAMTRLFAKQSEAVQIFRSYLTATHVNEVLPLLRGDSAFKETVRRQWRPSGIPKNWAPAQETAWSVAQPGENSCGLLEGSLPDHRKFSASFTNERDRLLLDWKATTAFGTASFAELAAGTGDPAEIRGQISASVFYSDTWPEADFRSYQLISATDEISIWVYVQRGSELEATIAPLLESGEIVAEKVDSQKVTLRLERGPDGALPNQWQIAELLHTGWVNPNPAP